MENTDDKIIELCHWVVRENKRKKNGFRNDLHLHLDRIKSLVAASVSPKLVMPERKTGLGRDVDFTIAAGWNSCLSELRRLYPSLFK